MAGTETNFSGSCIGSGTNENDVPVCEMTDALQASSLQVETNTPLGEKNAFVSTGVEPTALPNKSGPNEVSEAGSSLCGLPANAAKRCAQEIERSPAKQRRKQVAGWRPEPTGTAFSG